MSTTEDRVALTKQDVAAIQKAERLIFRHGHGAGVIEIVHKDERTRTTLSVASHVNKPFYENPLTDTEDRRVRCFHSASIYSFVETDPMGVFRCLKPGDVIRLAWSVDGNDNIRNAGLVADKLYLLVESGKKKWSALLYVCVCPVSSTARMISL